MLLVWLLTYAQMHMQLLQADIFIFSKYFDFTGVFTSIVNKCCKDEKSCKHRSTASGPRNQDGILKSKTNFIS